MIEWFLDLIGYEGTGHNLAELARRLDTTPESITSLSPAYREFELPKRSGGVRRIAAPEDELKQFQRRILRRLLARLRVHRAVTGFQRGQSFVTNARLHEGRAVVISLDIKDFFPSISARRVQRYFRAIGWNRKAARALNQIVTWQGRLPQGAPTSPRLSNLVNFRMDSRLARLAQSYDAIYTRYADDITISLNDEQRDVHELIAVAIAILQSEGYQPHFHKKFDVRRRHQRQEVTGLVVNDRVNLPRATRRWLRAVEHRAKSFAEAHDISSIRTADQARPMKKPTLTNEQLAGWRALRQMIVRQRENPDP
jgi:RNA-directed DNA polymerase